VAEPAPLRLGILGAARIAPAALLRPARDLPAATVVALAARDRTRAETFARRHDIPRVHTSYADLLADPEIDAVYNPLPNSLHCEWTVRALEAGKHVLCEKPIASNADEARHMAEAAEKTGRVLMEAFHYRYHPLAARMREIVASGELGRIRRIEAALCFPLLRRRDIRFDLSLAGGALMDAGCYAVNCVRFLADAEPEVVSARARLSSPGVDRRMDAELRFEGERLGKVTASLLSASLLRLSARVVGDEGELAVFNFVMPQLFHRLRVKTPRGSRSERVAGDATYTCQLRAFIRAVREGAPFETDAADAIANMRVIDAIYRAAGLEPRGRPSTG
jgi:predicted dehydrogenase